VIYVKNAETNRMEAIAADGSGTTHLGFSYSMEPSHATHGGRRWYVRQFARQIEVSEGVFEDELNPDGATPHNSLLLWDGVDTAIWITPPTNVSVGTKKLSFFQQTPRWVASSTAEDVAISYLGVEFAADGTVTGGGLFRTEITWIPDGAGGEIPVAGIHTEVADVDVVVAEMILVDQEGPPEYVPRYEVAAAGLDWNRIGAEFVLAKVFNGYTENATFELWLGDYTGAAPLQRASDGSIVGGFRPEWARAGAETIAFQAGLRVVNGKHAV
jgi:hypothetical protein